MIREFKKLPGIGRKTAERLALYLLSREDRVGEIEALSETLLAVRERIRFCGQCYNLTEDELCEICRDSSRDERLLCVVSHPRELLKIENTREFNGLYHVIGGLISPIDDVGPEDLKINALIERLNQEKVEEVIFAFNPKVEGEATAMYLAKLIKPIGVRISQIAHGVPVGRDLEFADEVTLSRALRGRRAFE